MGKDSRYASIDTKFHGNPVISTFLLYFSNGGASEESDACSQSKNAAHRASGNGLIELYIALSICIFVKETVFLLSVFDISCFSIFHAL